MGHISSSESNEYNNTRKLSRKRGAEHEEKEDGEGIIDLPPTANSTTLTTPLTAHAATDQFMHTPEFKRHFVEFVPVDALMALCNTLERMDFDRSNGTIYVCLD